MFIGDAPSMIMPTKILMTIVLVIHQPPLLNITFISQDDSNIMYPYVSRFHPILYYIILYPIISHNVLTIHQVLYLLGISLKDSRGFQLVMGVQSSSRNRSRWDFPVHKNHPILGGLPPWRAGNPRKSPTKPPRRKLLHTLRGHHGLVSACGWLQVPCFAGFRKGDDLGVSIVMGATQNGWFTREIPIKMYDLLWKIIMFTW